MTRPMRLISADRLPGECASSHARGTCKPVKEGTHDQARPEPHQAPLTDIAVRNALG